jgi:hypothetical protein
MKILLLDIETAPNTAYVWGLFKENVPLARLIESGYVLCWSAKWLGSTEIMYRSVQNNSVEYMLEGIHELLDEADAVVHYNGTRFDIPTLNKEFLLYGFAPPAPFKEIDLLRTARGRFRFTSNKLDYVASILGVGSKHKDMTFDVWVACMNDDPDAWLKMKAYNMNDVVILEHVYMLLRPWIKNHPNYSLYEEDSLVCPHCGSRHYHKRGFQYTNACKYQRFQCQKCSSWFRDTKSVAPSPGLKYVSA